MIGRVWRGMFLSRRIVARRSLNSMKEPIAIYPQPKFTNSAAITPKYFEEAPNKIAEGTRLLRIKDWSDSLGRYGLEKTNNGLRPPMKSKFWKMGTGRSQTSCSIKWRSRAI